LGGSDGEAIGEGFLAQPANALSSAGLAVAGLGVLLEARRRRAPVGEAAVFAAALAAAGLGSVDYHGPQSRLAHWGHDVGLVAGLAAVAAHDLGALLGWTSSTRNGVLAATVAATGAAAAVHPAAGMGASVAVGATVAVAETARLVQHPTDPRQRRLLGLSAAALSVGVVAYVLGRTGGPAAHPRSRVQGHALWHLLTAVSLGAWGAARLTGQTAPAGPQAQ
jgi:hypothetical protein